MPAATLTPTIGPPAPDAGSPSRPPMPPPSPSPSPPPHRRRRAGLVVALVAVALVVAGGLVALADDPGPEVADRSIVPAEGGTTGDVGLAEGPATTIAPGPPSPEGAGDAAGGAESTSPGPGVADVPVEGPRVVRTADLRISVDDGEAVRAVDRAADVAARHGGFVTSSSTAIADGASGGASGEVTIRVPVSEFDAARRELAALGTVEQAVVRGDDVTAQLVDLGARIRSLQAEEEAYRVLLAQARSVGDIITIQDQLFAVRTEIEQLQAQEASLGAAADLSTIRVVVVEPGAEVLPPPVDDEPGVLARGLERGVGGTLAVLAGTLVVLGYAVPLALLGLLAWLVVALVSRARRHPRPPAPAD
ncbi:MAG: DUF4349 domain-containing protein [Acidimicrobiales bacterium]|nr:DUF4349 domain-containing protein [Acidimicrobiales bacterium]